MPYSAEAQRKDSPEDAKAPKATRMQPGTVDPAKHTATMADKSNDNSSLNKGPKYVQTIAQPRSYFVPAGVGAAGFLGTHMALNSLPPTGRLAAASVGGALAAFAAYRYL